MFPFDNKAITICKKNKCVFFEHVGRIIYGEYGNHSYINKSLPGMTVEDKKEIDFIAEIIGKEYIRIVSMHYIEFFDPNVVEFEQITAPLCTISEGHFTYLGDIYTGSVPSPQMLKAAECIYSVIKMCIIPRLAREREERFYTEFFKNSLDGCSSIIRSSLSADKLPKDFLVLMKKRQTYDIVFFVILKTMLYKLHNPKYLSFVLPKEHFSFVANRKELIEKRLKTSIYLSSK